MKKQLTPQQRTYRDNRDRKIINIISSGAFMGLGIWMLLDPSDKKHASVEKATTALVKEIWGMEAGIVCLVLGGLWMFFAIRGLIRFKRATPRPQ